MMSGSMTDEGSTGIWNILQEFGFDPDVNNMMSDIRPGLRFDFGNFTLHASAVVENQFQDVVLFTGVLSTARTIAEVCFEIPRNPMSHELVAARLALAPGPRGSSR